MSGGATDGMTRLQRQRAMSNYERAKDEASSIWAAQIPNALGTVTYAILALVDELREHRGPQ